MSSALKNIVLIGASVRNGPTGNLGSYVLKTITSNFNVTVISRKSTESSFDPSVKVIKISDNYPEDELIKAFTGQDAVVLTTGHALAGKDISIVDAAIKAGIKRFIPSEFGSNSQNKDAVAKVLLNPEATANKYLYISSFELSQNDILASLEKTTPGEKWELTKVNSDEQIKEAREALAKGEFMKAGKLVLAASYKGGLGANFAEEETLANTLLGLEPEELDVVVAENV